MESDGTEITVAEAASVVGYGKLHLVYGGNSAKLLVIRMVFPFKGERIYRVQFCAGERRHWRGLHQNFIPVILYKGFTDNVVLVFCLNIKGFCKKTAYLFLKYRNPR